MTVFATGISKKDEIFQAVLEQMSEGITIVNTDDRVIFVNRMAEEVRNIKALSQLEYLRGEERKAFRRIVFDPVREVL